MTSRRSQLICPQCDSTRVRVTQEVPGDQKRPHVVHAACAACGITFSAVKCKRRHKRFHGGEFLGGIVITALAIIAFFAFVVTFINQCERFAETSGFASILDAPAFLMIIGFAGAALVSTIVSAAILLAEGFAVCLIGFLVTIPIKLCRSAF